jgi:crotonobetainyl-CoA:carnitine CoA-transferase CaiB-like acyl-CoA transferase
MGVLDGVKVVELAEHGFVPSCGAILADWGAEVVKIERPTGDPLRMVMQQGFVADTGDFNFLFELYNRNKRGITLDLRIDEGRAVFDRLIEGADVFITNFLPSAREKLHVTPDELWKVNPTLVYAKGHGQGQRGPDADLGGFDAISFWARGGVAATITPPDVERPVGQPGGAFGDSISGMALAGGVAAALLRRTRTGEGAVVDVALLGTAMWSLQMSISGAAVMMAQAASGAPAPTPAQQLFNPLVGNYRTSDDRWVALCMLQRDKYWDGVLVALGRDDLRTDARFATPDALGGHIEEAAAELQQTIATMTLAEACAALASQPGQWDVMQTVLELPADPQAVANGFVQPVAYDGDVVMPMVASPAQFDRTPPTLGRAPEFGADTDDVLQALGMDMDAIIEAKIDGAVV